MTQAEENMRGEGEAGDDIERQAPDGAGEAKDVQRQAEEHEQAQASKFGTFAGVFTPTLLTILGVIMFLRLGWVTGNAGLGGAWAIIGIAFVITGFTALSMSSFVTNIRVGAGGAFSMISQSLGLEVGGALGVPLFVAQALGVVMYVFGFRAGWEWAAQSMGLPALPSIAIDLIVFGLILSLTLISTRFAMRIHFLILAVIAASIASVAIAAFTGPMDNPIVWWGEFAGAPEENFPGTTFWVVFAVFFPAATGIMAGANMSGDLKNPRRAIPVGTLAAVAISFVVYLALAWWMMRAIPMEELLANYTAMIDYAFWGPAVLAGLLAATFSSALASFVGAPRILQALAVHRIVPVGGWLARTTNGNEPRNAAWLTSVIVIAGLMLRDLNAIAPLITMFFLLTYATINLVVLIEQRLRLLSYRPMMKVPTFVPLMGLAGCLLVMFIVNPVFSLVALVLVVALYFVLVHRTLAAPMGDVRSGLFTALAEWAAKGVRLSRGTAERAWKPNLLVPIEDPGRLHGQFELLHHLTHPMGSIKLLGMAPEGDVERVEAQLEDSVRAFQDRGVFAMATVLRSERFQDDLRTGMQALAGAFFRPNVLFLQLPKDRETHAALNDLMAEARRLRMGVALLVEHETARLGRRERVNLWVPDQGREWKLDMEFPNLDLAILLAYRLADSWNGALNVIATIDDAAHEERAQEFLVRLVELARLPAATSVHVADGDFGRYASQAPHADINVFPLPSEFDTDLLWHLR
ncbi:MAG: amino acid permease, partial [Rhodococcus sp. (in: high G+C Gram-positive bacteria)]